MREGCCNDDKEWSIGECFTSGIKYVQTSSSTLFGRGLFADSPEMHYNNLFDQPAAKEYNSITTAHLIFCFPLGGQNFSYHHLYVHSWFTPPPILAVLGEIYFYKSLSVPTLA
jgi:hypothetical protein